MKKAIKAAALLLALMALCMAFSACGGNSEEQKAEETKPVNNVLTNADGVTLLENSAINSSDEEAQAKIEQYLAAKNYVAKMTPAYTSEYYTPKIYAQGNALVFEMDVTADLTAAEKQALSNTAQAIGINAEYTLAQGRKDTGVSDLAVAVVFVDRDGSVITSMVCDKESTAPTAAPYTEPADGAAYALANGQEENQSYGQQTSEAADGAAASNGAVRD